MTMPRRYSTMKRLLKTVGGGSSLEGGSIPPPRNPMSFIFGLISNNNNASAMDLNNGVGAPVGNGLTPDMPQKRVVRAMYDYKAAQKGDLSLVQDEEYEVLEETEEHWWKLRDKHGNEGYSPSNYVKEATDIGLHQYDWYLGDATRQRAETILMREEREGCFVVRNSSSTTGMYTISVYCSMSRPQVKHYHIQKDSDNKYYLSHNIKCNSISELIYKHQYNPGGLCTRLRSAPLGNKPPATAGFSRDKWDIPLNEITLLEEIGSGQFGVVRRGKYRNLDVAVKMMKEGTMSEDEFIEEAKVMTKLQHPNLVQLYGVCKRQRPVYIITEFLEYGSLLHYLRQKEKTLSSKTDTLIDMCLQICEGMAYLEKEKFIHRDLAARNCLVGSKNIKVGDFGLARYVVDDEYTGSGGAKFPIKWAAPEVLNYMRFSSKSDVWAFGVLMWEVFTCGKMPYGRRKNADVVAMVQEGLVLDQPRYCPHNVYQVMRECWEQSADQRPSFHDLKTEIGRLNTED
ncbi:tyrosine-protein kinase Btk29A isoform X3 [Hyalella azteca]|uniref:Tyrosine-protein kinase n=1 Tax=Hyalella azteca TaxID=294128 RepID=A0A8B7P7L5_HYAAZ|nr:tyrosine-protein kinase Btk29A isoform X3 [Hyalella azteca]